jgi:hypothetical protein
MTCATHDTAQPVRRSSAPSGSLRGWGAVAVGAAIALGSWALAAVHTQAQRVSRLERSDELRSEQLERIEAKLDALLVRER